ncbi:MAG: Asp-tRNA(Asn)/Glu-tRNA(Gln) amidotransferase subunit GatB [Nitrospinae bacterium]|nr:Asp-tRNA(Asn)/Glu-tRNA(Gln) amidotransferase subunit GatB [Nitrospinota bacterium]
MNYEVVIGLEVHVQLNTESKIFCSCSTTFGKSANENTCPICLGFPGVLPVFNKKVAELAINLGLATGCSIEKKSVFERKNYFYPDLPKGYQITQYELPLCLNGFIEIGTNGSTKKIGITRIHLEEDAGKSIHGENLDNPDYSYIDLNRTGTPLCEIVSEPDLRSADEAKEYLSNLKQIIEYLEVSDCNMEEGSLRCDANISIRKPGETKLGTKAELKNMNSFNNIKKAIDYEVERQIKLVESGEKVIQETRLWDANEGKSKSMRSKEEANDYRYFPDPDLPPLIVEDSWVEELRKELPELPAAKKERFIQQYEIPEYDAGVLTSSKQLSVYFEQMMKNFDDGKIASNWVMTELLRALKEDERNVSESPISPEDFVSLLQLIKSDKISGKIAKTVFEEAYKTGKKPEKIVEEKGLVQVSDSGELEAMIDEVIVNNPEEVEGYRNGKQKLFGFLVGQCMKLSRGKGNPKVINEILKKKLEN